MGYFHKMTLSNAETKLPPANIAMGPYYFGPDYSFPGWEALELLPGSFT